MHRRRRLERHALYSAAPHQNTGALAEILAESLAQGSRTGTLCTDNDMHRRRHGQPERSAGGGPWEGRNGEERVPERESSSAGARLRAVGSSAGSSGRPSKRLVAQLPERVLRRGPAQDARGQNGGPLTTRHHRRVSSHRALAEPWPTVARVVLQTSRAEIPPENKSIEPRRRPVVAPSRARSRSRSGPRRPSSIPGPEPQHPSPNRSRLTLEGRTRTAGGHRAQIGALWDLCVSRAMCPRPRRLAPVERRVSRASSLRSCLRSVLRSKAPSKARSTVVRSGYKPN